MAYCDDPDGTIHNTGVNSEETKEFVKKSELLIKDMIKKLDDDTVVIISADHGHKDIEHVYYLENYEKLLKYTYMPIQLESRCVTFFVKEEDKNKFIKEFNIIFKNDFILLTKKEFIESNILGYGNIHEKVYDFIGDFVAVSISSSIINISSYYFKGKKVKISTHCGITKEEMEVPVIVLNKKKSN